MPNHEIRIKTPSTTPNPGPKPVNYCTWKCAFCQGRGLNPYGKSATERCPACHGRTAWEADAACAALTSCGRCAGTGRINYMGSWAPCTDCKGSGKL